MKLNAHLVIAYLCLSVLSGTIQAQTAVFTSGVLTENFDNMTATGCPCNTGLSAGWSVTDSDNRWAVGTGTTGIGDLYLLGTGADKALGSVRAGNAPMWGVNVNNNTGSVISSIRIQFAAESWRVINRGTPDLLDFQYNIGGGAIGDLTTAPGWVGVSALQFRTIPLAAGGTTTTGAANSTVLMDYTITGISIPAGTNVFFRWIDVDVTGTDDAAAIDDVVITANPSCGGAGTYISQDFETAIPGGSCWSTGGMNLSATNAIYNTASGRTSSTGAIAGSAADQIKANITQTGLYETLNSSLPSTVTWQFTVRTDLAGQAISTTNLWGYFLYTNQSNLISTTSNTGYAVGVNLGGSADRTIKLYKLNAQRWDLATITTLVTSSYVYPPTAATLVDRNLTVRVTRTGSKTAASWELFINNVSQGTFADASPVLPANTTTPSFTSGFFNIHNAARNFEIDDIVAYSGIRPCNTASSVCRVGTLLPLNLMEFKGAPVGNMISLEWQVGAQADSRTFEIERSTGGTSFEKIGNLPIDQSKNRYRFLTPQSAGLTYYRIKIIDNDGSVTYSQVIQIKGNSKIGKSLFISPNPVLNDATVIFSTIETGMLKVLNSSGTLLFQQKVSNQQQVTFSTRTLQKGNYIIIFTGGSGSVLADRFVKL